MSLGSSLSLAVERIVQPVEGMHRAIAGRWFTAVGPAGKPVRLVHDRISDLVYNSIRLGATAVGYGLDARSSVGSSSGGTTQALVNGLWGDELGRHEHRVGTSMSVRSRQGFPIALDEGTVEAFPAATDRIVVLLHGLIETERRWAHPGPQPGLLDSLEAHPGVTPITVRYNTGLALATNGAGLASLLEDLVLNWPVPVRSIALVGHSMGGLVVRSACLAARLAGHSWVDDVDDIVTIGSPHRGTPLEKLAGIGARGLSIWRSTEPLADFINSRSQGIKDLSSGDIGYDTNLVPAVDEVLPDIRHHFVAGVVTSDPAHPIGAAIGDLVVGPVSSSSAPEVEPTNVAVFGGVNHFDMVHDPAVVEQVMDWLAPAD